MRIINFFLTLATLYFANQFFPDVIYFESINTVLLVTVILFAVRYAIALGAIASVALIPIGIGCLTIVPMLIGALAATPLTLYYADMYMESFSIAGTVPFLLLWATLSVFSITTQNKKTDTQK